MSDPLITCPNCEMQFLGNHITPIEYIFVFVSITGQVVDITNLDADYGTLQELADDGWRIFYQNPWQPAIRQSAIAGAPQQQILLSTLTLWRVKNEMKPFEGLTRKDQPAEESILIT